MDQHCTCILETFKVLSLLENKFDTFLLWSSRYPTPTSKIGTLISLDFEILLSTDKRRPSQSGSSIQREPRNAMQSCPLGKLTGSSASRPRSRDMVDWTRQTRQEETKQSLAIPPLFPPPDCHSFSRLLYPIPPPSFPVFLFLVHLHSLLLLLHTRLLLPSLIREPSIS